MINSIQLEINLLHKVNMYIDCRADKINFCNEKNIFLPIADHKGRVPTLNKMGHMCTVLDEISLAFIKSSKNASGPVLEIGAAYGAASRRALANDARVFANDIDRDHLCLLKQQVNSEYWNRLYLNNTRFPNETNFPENMFSSILMCRVAHFLSGSEMEIAMEKIYRWLVPGGKFFFLVLSPFHRRFGSFLPIYEKRWAEGILWPGEMNEGRSIWPEFSEYIPEFIHVMDERPIKLVMEKAGFHIQRNELFGNDSLKDNIVNRGEYLGVIAIKGKTDSSCLTSLI